MLEEKSSRESNVNFFLFGKCWSIYFIVYFTVYTLKKDVAPWF